MANTRGISYRLTVVNGTLTTSEDIDLIRDHIFSVLETEPGERVMQLRYGTPDFLFQGIQDINVIAQLVRQQLEAEIDEATFAVTGRINDAGGSALAVNWSVQGIPQAPLNFELVN